jgi:hypothetical protein
LCACGRSRPKRDELGQVIRSRIDQREPTARSQDPRRLGEILGREHAEHEIGGGIPHGPVGPQVGDRKGKAGPPARRAPGRGLGDVESQADHGPDRGCLERRSDAGEMMAGAATRVEHAPRLDGPRRAGARHMLRDRPGDGVEMAGVEEGRSMVELLGAIAAGDQAAAPAVEQIDVSVARDVEAVAIAAGEAARIAGKIKTADGTAQQSMAGTGRARRHAAAPSSPTA